MKGEHDIMGEHTLALAISHTPWIPERVESMRRLRGQLETDPDRESGPCFEYREFTERAPNDQWSESMWTWAAETRATHALFLQDDVRVAPNFWSAIHAMIEAVPDQVIGLETVHPAAAALCEDDARWCTTSEGLIGVGYVIPTGSLREFLEWRRKRLRDGWRTGGPGGTTAITEDTLIDLWCLATERRIWHPIPTIIDHDTDIPSTYGNDAHGARRPSVRWDSAKAFACAWSAEDLETPAFWHGRYKRLAHVEADETVSYLKAENLHPNPVRHVGRFYGGDGVLSLARAWVEGFDEVAYGLCARDRGETELRRLAHLQAAKNGYAPKSRVLVCTPTRETTHPQYNSTVWRVLASTGIQLLNPWEIIGVKQWGEDVVRVRSRFVRTALQTDATHIWFLDADISCDPDLPRRMIDTGRDIVLAPYARRDRIDFRGAAEAIAAGLPPEAGAYKTPLQLLAGGLRVEADGCAEIRSAGLGCAMIRRTVLERMVEHYAALDAQRVKLAEALTAAEDMRKGHDTSAPELLESLVEEVSCWRAGHMGLRFEDDVQGEKHPTLALFQLLSRDGSLYSEDRSFCERAHSAGFAVHLYLGPSSPAVHHGSHSYALASEAFGIKHVPT